MSDVANLELPEQMRDGGSAPAGVAKSVTQGGRFQIGIAFPLVVALSLSLWYGLYSALAWIFSW